jgi:hypothetical protein
MIFDNSEGKSELIAEKLVNSSIQILQDEKYILIKTIAEK